MTEWWQDFFDETYEQLFAETRGPARTAQEAAGLVALLNAHGVGQDSQVLDLACGAGRLTVPLAEAGFQMTGLDQSPHLLGSARAAAQAAAVDIPFHLGDMRELPADWNGRFEAVINTFTAFGYFQDAQEDQQVLNEIAKVLKTQGLFIIDVGHRDRMMADYRSSDWFEVDDLLVCVTRQFDAVSGVNTEIWLWVDEEGQRQSRSFQVRVYNATQLGHMLLEAGLRPVAYHGLLATPPEAFPFDAFSSRLVIVAQRQVTRP